MWKYALLKSFQLSECLPFYVFGLYFMTEKSSQEIFLPSMVGDISADM